MSGCLVHKPHSDVSHRAAGDEISCCLPATSSAAGRCMSPGVLLAHLTNLLGRDEDDGGVAPDADRAHGHAGGGHVAGSPTME